MGNDHLLDSISLKDALKGLREGQGHVEHNETRDVREHLQYAIMKLLEVRGR